MYPKPPRFEGAFPLGPLHMTKTTAILIDGGFLRSLANKAKLTYDPDFIASFAASCATNQEEIFRILYYDCAPFVGQAKLPVSGMIREFKGDSRWLDELAGKDLFAQAISSHYK
jgi:hypothetical protein